MGTAPVRRSAVASLSALAAIVLLPASIQAGECHLIITSGGGSPASVEVGDVVSVEGFGFMLGDVALAITVDGAAVRTEIVTAADAFGNVGYFIVDFTMHEAGFWEVVATEADGGCSASDGFPVALAAGATPTPAPVVPDVAIAPPRTPPSVAWLFGAALLLTAVLMAVGWPAGTRRR